MFGCPRPVGLLLACALLSSPAAAQHSWGGIPASSYHTFANPAPTVWMPPVDEAVLLAEDATQPRNAPLRYGALIPADLSPDVAGVWETLPGGDAVWRLRVASPGAKSIGLIFSDFELPAGAELFVFDDRMERVLGSYTHRNNDANREFQIEPLGGDVANIEFVLPASAASSGSLEISEVVHDYRGVIDILMKSSDGSEGEDGNCEIDVNCSVGINVSNTKRAVARTLFGGSLCTGSFLNNTAGNGDPLFVSANHCGSLSNAVFHFNFELSGCGGGSINTVTASNAQTLTFDGNIDFRLVRITGAIPAAANPWLAGWDKTGNTPPSTYCIQHPNGGVKKISVDNNSPGKTSLDWQIFQWDLGITASGSSGSPLYTPQHRFIGNLFGGSSFCPTPFNDFYPRLELNGYKNKVTPFIDPIGTGANVLDGMNLSGGGPPANCDITQYGTGFGGANIGTLSSTAQAQIGTNPAVSYSGFNGPSSGLLILAGTNPTTPLLGGTVLIDFNNPFATLTAPIGGGGSGSTTVPIPNNPGFIGITGYGQVGTNDGTAPAGWAFSNGLTFPFCN